MPAVTTGYLPSTRVPAPRPRSSARPDRPTRLRATLSSWAAHYIIPDICYNQWRRTVFRQSAHWRRDRPWQYRLQQRLGIGLRHGQQRPLRLDNRRKGVYDRSRQPRERCDFVLPGFEHGCECRSSAPGRGAGSGIYIRHAGAIDCRVNRNRFCLRLTDDAIGYPRKPIATGELTLTEGARFWPNSRDLPIRVQGSGDRDKLPYGTAVAPSPAISVLATPARLARRISLRSKETKGVLAGRLHK